MDSYITRGEHEEFAKRINEEDNRQNRRIAALEDNLKQLNELTLAVEKMALSMERMAEEQKRQREHIDELESVPKKSWDTIKYGILGAIASGIGAGIIAMLINFM